MALGARALTWWLIVGEGMKVAGSAACSVSARSAMARLMRALLYQIEFTDPAIRADSSRSARSRSRPTTCPPAARRASSLWPLRHD
jgi:hypothetical protein